MANLLRENKELQDVLCSFKKEFEVGPILYFISDNDIKNSKGKNRAGKSKNVNQDMKPQTSKSSSENKDHKQKDPKDSKTPNIQEQKIGMEESSINALRNVQDTGRKLGFVPYDMEAKIRNSKKDPSKNAWNLHMSDISRDQIRSYLDRYLRAEDPLIVESISNHEPTFIQMVSTAVIHWKDQQLIDFLFDMVEDILKTSTEDTNRWLVNNKVVLAVVLIACFRGDEDILVRTMKIIRIATKTPKFIERGVKDNGMIEEIVIMSHFVLKPLKRYHDHILILADIIIAIGYMAVSMDAYQYNKDDVKNIKKWIAEKGIIDVVVDFHSTPFRCKLNPKEVSIMNMYSIFLIDWVKEEVSTKSILPTIPIILVYLDDQQFNKKSPYDMNTEPISTLTIQILDHVIRQLSFGEVMRLINKDILDNIMSYGRVHPTREQLMLDFFAVVVQKVPLGELGEMSGPQRQKLDDMMKHIANIIQQSTVTSSNFKVSLTQLYIIRSIFMNASKDLSDTMIDNGTFRMMIETLLKSEYKVDEKDKTDLKSHHVTFIATKFEYFFTTIELMIYDGGEATVLKIAKVMKPFMSMILFVVAMDASELTVSHQKLITRLTNTCLRLLTR